MTEPDTRSANRRNRSLDGIRGLLATVVLIHHAFPGHMWLLQPANLAVFGFFVLSGIVLTEGWDGRFGAFLLRRFVRLWPMYALCLAAGFLLAGVSPIWTQFFWVPFITTRDPVPINPPAWSLCIEAAAMLFMPIVVRCKGLYAFIGIAACFALSFVESTLGFGAFFVIGAALSESNIRWRILETAVPQYLGRVSYPLYLSHWLVLTYLPGPLALKLAAAFLIAHLLTVTVERWSIDASRAVSRRAWRRRSV